jgi:hypothetical protein
MQTTFLSLSQVAALIGIRRHRIEYALTSGFIPEPRRFLNKRAFDAAEVRAVASYFGRNDPQCDKGVEPCSASTT